MHVAKGREFNLRCGLIDSLHAILQPDYIIYVLTWLLSYSLSALEHTVIYVRDTKF